MGIVSIIAFVVILAALASAGYFMLRASGSADDDDASPQAANARQKRMAKALTVRIAVSVLLFITVLLAWKFGYIQPSGLPIGR